MRRTSIAFIIIASCYSTALQADALEATITGVQGLVQVRNDNGDAWQKAAVGMKLSQGAEFRTGPRSAVQFTIPPAQTITLDRLGTVKLLTAVQNADGDNYKTDLGMKYGRTRYDIQAGGGAKYESKISTPSATLSVKGTSTGLQDGPFGFSAWSTHNFVNVRDNFKRNDYAFGPGGNVDNNSQGPGDHAQKQGSVHGGGDRNTLGGGDGKLFVHDPSGNLGNKQGGGPLGNQRNRENFRRVIDEHRRLVEDFINVIATVNTTKAFLPVLFTSQGPNDMDRVAVTINGQVLDNNLLLNQAGTQFEVPLNIGPNLLVTHFVDQGTNLNVNGSVHFPADEIDSANFQLPTDSIKAGDQSATVIINRELKVLD